MVKVSLENAKSQSVHTKKRLVKQDRAFKVPSLTKQISQRNKSRGDAIRALYSSKDGVLNSKSPHFIMNKSQIKKP